MAERKPKKRRTKVETKVVEKLIKTNLRKKEVEVTEDEIVYFQNNLYELERITSAVATKKLYLIITVLIGALLVALSIILKTNLSQILHGFVTDLLFEGGVAMWGAAITVYMLEIMMHRQEIINRQYRREVLREIEKRREEEDQ